MSVLKTLKDFEDVPCEDFAPHSCEGRKRLKEELKEAAREWVNELEEDYLVGTRRDGQIDWIKEFFNLEDED